MSRQLNIRSDEAWETARLLAERLGKTTTQVVVDALRAYRDASCIPSTKVTPEEARANRATLMQMIKEANRNRPPGLTSDHSDLYDDDGLPI